MDTRFWGPSGWKLLHLIASDDLTPARRKAVARWFALLEYVLPCKYCRASFHDYTQIQPLTEAVLTAGFGRWLYDIHNRVNEKLRGQGLVTAPNPPWAEVESRYERLHRDLCKGSPLLGWDFMTSIAYTTPEKGYKSTPMPDTPEWPIDTADIGQRNRYNLLTRQERLAKLAAWWRLIPAILPCEAWRRAWTAALKTAGDPPLDNGREAVMRWMWRVEEGVCSGLRCPTPHPSLPALRKEVSAFESGCSLAKRGKTCRSKKRMMRLRRKTQRVL